MVVSNASWFERSDGMRCYELIFLEPFLRAQAWREQQLRWCARMEDSEGEKDTSWKPLEERIAERLQHSLREMDADDEEGFWAELVGAVSPLRAGEVIEALHAFNAGYLDRVRAYAAQLPDNFVNYVYTHRNADVVQQLIVTGCLSKGTMRRRPWWSLHGMRLEQIVERLQSDAGEETSR